MAVKTAIPCGSAGSCGASLTRTERRVGARLSGRWRSLSAVRYGLLDAHLFCIFIHRNSWGECPLLPLWAHIQPWLSCRHVPLMILMAAPGHARPPRRAA